MDSLKTAYVWVVPHWGVCMLGFQVLSLLQWVTECISRNLCEPPKCWLVEMTQDERQLAWVNLRPVVFSSEFGSKCKGGRSRGTSQPPPFFQSTLIGVFQPAGVWSGLLLNLPKFHVFHLWSDTGYSTCYALDEVCMCSVKVHGKRRFLPCVETEGWWDLL